MIRRNPGFTTVAILTLALGIGANTAIYSVVNAVLLRPLPIPEPERVVVLHDQLPKLNLPRTGVSPPQYDDYRAHTNLFESTALLLSRNFNLTGTDQPQRVPATRATASFFQTLGIQPVLGRPFSPADDVYANRHVALLSHGMWQRMFGADSGVVGKRLQLDGDGYEIIGVLPQQLAVLYPDTQLWIPMALSTEEMQRRGTIVYTMLARLRPGVTLEQARAEMATHALRSNSLGGFGIEVRPLVEEQVGDVRQPLYILLGAVGLVLLIACANMANLLLARGGGRTREIAIRAAMGAGRGRIVAQLLAESILLAMLGGALGLLVAEWSISALVRFAPATLPHAGAIRLDLPVLGFTLAVSLAAGILFGLAPAFHAARTDLMSALKEGGRAASEGPGRHGLGRALVVCELALALVLLVCSGLLLRSFQKLLNVDPGFDPNHVLTLRISLPRTKYPGAARVATFSDALLERVASVPGVLHAALANQPPLFPDMDNSMFAVRDYHPGPNDPLPHADTVYATPDYFAAMGIPLLRGRLYTQEEMSLQQPGPAVVIDEALARRFWPGQDAVGKSLGWSANGPWATIVGVVGTVHSSDVATESKGTIYFPFRQAGQTLVVRTAGDPRALAGLIREKVQALDPDQPVYDVKTMAERLAASLDRRRFAAALLALFAALALVLAMIGLNGVVAFLVAQRTHEIGIRMALGAQRVDVLRLVLRQGLAMALGGVGAGLIGAVVATRLLASQLFGVHAIDPLTFLAVPLLLTAAALLASYLPARRATRVDPIVALRYE